MAGILITAGLAMARSDGADSPIRIQLDSGIIEGLESSTRIRVFKGIPFAAPPVGDLRWRAPQPVKAWSGVRDARKFGPDPMPAFSKPNEDCLYLNVWTGAKSDTERRPVMVYIYGGAFNGGASSDGLYDGTKFAGKGVVLVTFNHRVGIFGFLAHPELSRESGKGSGCYGIQDQIAALRWVKANITRFGGDPSNVTVFGQSSGGTSVSILTQSPLAKGLFHRAICQSGGAMAPIKPALDKPGGMIVALPVAEEQGGNFLASLGVKDIQAARALGADAVQKGKKGWPWPVADGGVIVGDPHDLYRSGQFNDTPILVGFTSNDGGFFGMGGAKTPEDFVASVRKNFGDGAEAILSAYPHATRGEASRSSGDLARETLFSWPAWAWANRQSTHGKGKAFMYYFDYGGKPGEAAHGAEVPYVFGVIGGLFRPSASAANTALSETIMSYWVNFATHGDPNGPGLPSWPHFDAATHQAMIFGRVTQAGNPPNADKLKAFDRYDEIIRQTPK